MKRTYINDALQKTDEQVLLQGWVHNIRDHGKIKFLILRDVTGLIQGVVTKDAPDVFTALESLSRESVVEISGLIKDQSQAPAGKEILLEKIKVLSRSEPELPIPVIEKKQNETEQSLRLDWRWLDLRKPEKLLIFKVSSAIENSFRSFMLNNQFIQIHSPKLMNTASESGAEVFEVKYFDKKAYLAQSPQFYKQMAMAAGFERVFEIGPVFRAEPSFTSRHMTEYTGFDFEMSFIDSYEDVMKMIEEMMIYILKDIENLFKKEIKEVFDREFALPSSPFPRISIKEAKAKIAKYGIPSEKEGDLNQEEEKKLCEIIKDEQGSEFVFLTEYPIESRAFYHMRFEENLMITKSFDLLWNGIEISTGAQREHRYNILKEQAIEKGLETGPLNSYFEFFKYGCPPEGGCGIGSERILMKILDLPNIREATYLPRTVHRLTP